MSNYSLYRVESTIKTPSKSTGEGHLPFLSKHSKLFKNQMLHAHALAPRILSHLFDDSQASYCDCNFTFICWLTLTIQASPEYSELITEDKGLYSMKIRELNTLKGPQMLVSTIMRVSRGNLVLYQGRYFESHYEWGLNPLLPMNLDRGQYLSQVYQLCLTSFKQVVNNLEHRLTHFRLIDVLFGQAMSHPLILVSID